MSQTELIVEDIEIGVGAEVTGRGQTLLVHYTGWLEDGTQFDSSRDLHEPFGFPVAVGYVIKGWDEGVIGMQVGGIRRLIVPPQLAYGAQGAGEIIPPNATLKFEIELIEVSE